MIVKIHSTPNGKIAAVCDKEILGKIFEEGKRQLDLSSEFYKGKEMTEKDLDRIVCGCYILNIVGKKSVGWAIKKGLIDADKIIRISSVPHAQCVLARES